MTNWIGTSGFQYAEWKGKFYPEDISAAKMLAYYSARFSTTEVNYSFRRIPSIAAVTKWAEATPEEFRFSFKAPQKVTHFAKLRNCGDVLEVFARAISEMREKLGIVLFQLPPTFKKDAPLLAEFLGQLPAAFRAAFEFRHASWFDDDVFEALRSHNVALCIAETEDFATPFVATADFAYLRPRREDYTDAKISDWSDHLRSQEGQWREAFIYFKHEETAIGPKFAGQLVELLKSARSK
jgi:uncharacterized protein YecE (DUF72 family)